MEIHKTNITQELKFTATSYENDGFTLNTNENGVEEYFIVDKIKDIVWFIGLASDVGRFFKEEVKEEVKEEPKSNLTEDFVLKMLAVANGKVKDVDLN